ncbi:MAG TPA: hypothetical protein VI454_11775, partial [Verrucomicrobiae bacterium]
HGAAGRRSTGGHGLGGLAGDCLLDRSDQFRVRVSPAMFAAEKAHSTTRVCGWSNKHKPQAKKAQ